MTSYIRIGGVALEPARGGRSRSANSFADSRRRWTEYENLLDSNPIWNIRTRGVGYISLEDMLDLGVTGPMLRGAGLALDCRKT